MLIRLAGMLALAVLGAASLVRTAAAGDCYRANMFTDRAGCEQCGLKECVQSTDGASYTFPCGTCNDPVYGHYVMCCNMNCICETGY
jgi:hypothetical protein